MMAQDPESIPVIANISPSKFSVIGIHSLKENL